MYRSLSFHCLQFTQLARIVCAFGTKKALGGEEWEHKRQATKGGGRNVTFPLRFSIYIQA